MNATHIASSTIAAAIAVLLPVAQAQESNPAKLAEIVETYGSPGPGHKVFDSLAGAWKAESTYWLTPGAPALTSSGTARVRPLLGGRYLNEQYRTKSEELGQFEGRGTLAYDRLGEEYVHTWIDTMNTGIMISRGKLSEDGKAIVMHSKFKDPVTRQDLAYRIVSQLGDGKKRTMEMFVTHPGQDEHKLMEIVYTKVSKQRKREKSGEPRQKKSAEADTNPSDPLAPPSPPTGLRIVGKGESKD